ncbi:hypothetical protein NADFUDRAFT_20858 [Nadsonia fulvescens var. elongata DSM 6958]|uniref:S-adenosyl-L-methionine-dependent methyltransferase n=1 Tax=Nadsonia fulvescens var. elongata DSM 6958 TaxID=857566 RepID=A0A1E3PSK0_9ASCO|nr:hypothetical protein NADFUDRAFT_20858 [Nadsonia fulvescens var. elongata DSM 6958]
MTIDCITLDREDLGPNETTKGQILNHVLDLPSLNTKPSAVILLKILYHFQPKPTQNFGPSATDDCDSDDDDKQVSFSSEGLFTWFTHIVGSPLAWISSDETKDAIWHQASLRMAERCGRTAQPEIRRRITIKDLDEQTRQLRNLNKDEFLEEIELIEPSLTADSLGLKTWGSSLMLSQRLVNDSVKDELLMDPILELGAGTGLVGITMARLGHEVVVSDLAEIIDNLNHNVQHNHDNITVEELDWSNPSTEFDQKYSSKFNTLVLSDPIYSSRHPPWIRDMIVRYMRKTAEARTLIQVPIREKFEKERDVFWTLLNECGLERVMVDTEHGWDDFGKQEFIWSMWTWKDL